MNREQIAANMIINKHNNTFIAFYLLIKRAIKSPKFINTGNIDLNYGKANIAAHFNVRHGGWIKEIVTPTFNISYTPPINKISVTLIYKPGTNVRK